jgi:hypothetical protein
LPEEQDGEWTEQRDEESQEFPKPLRMTVRRDMEKAQCKFVSGRNYVVVEDCCVGKPVA